MNKKKDLVLMKIPLYYSIPLLLVCISAFLILLSLFHVEVSSFSLQPVYSNITSNESSPENLPGNAQVISQIKSKFLFKNMAYWLIIAVISILILILILLIVRSLMSRLAQDNSPPNRLYSNLK